jgi:hypothetical protein
VVSVHAFELVKEGRCKERCQQPAEKDCLSNMERSTRSLEGNQATPGGSSSTAKSHVILLGLLGALLAIALIASIALFVIKRCAKTHCAHAVHLDNHSTQQNFILSVSTHIYIWLLLVFSSKRVVTGEDGRMLDARVLVAHMQTP